MCKRGSSLQFKVNCALQPYSQNIAKENKTLSDVSTSSPASPKLLRSSAIVSVMTMLSRVLGLVRDVVFARYIGAEAGADAFFIAFKIPNFLRRLFAEGAFAQAFVPVLSEYRQTGTHAAVKALLDRVAGCLGVTLVGVTVFAVVCSPLLTMIFAPGFSHDGIRFSLASDMIRIYFSLSLAYISDWLCRCNIKQLRPFRCSSCYSRFA